jgi:hypothetical protein
MVESVAGGGEEEYDGEAGHREIDVQQARNGSELSLPKRFAPGWRC